MEIKKEGIVTKRIRNQLRIHWSWLKEVEDYNEVADFIDACIKQAISIHKNRLDRLHDLCKCGDIKWKTSK